jgi:hypothetical protein
LIHIKTFEAIVDLMVVNVIDGYVVHGVGKANEVPKLNEEVGVEWWNTLMKLANCIASDDGCINCIFVG